MNRQQTIEQFGNMVDNIVADVEKHNYDEMRAGIGVALAFLDARTTDHSIRISHGQELYEEMRNSVFAALHPK